MRFAVHLLRKSLSIFIVQFFIRLSYLFLYGAWCLGEGVSAFNLMTAVSFLKGFFVFIVLGEFVVRLISRCYPISHGFLGFYLFVNSLGVSLLLSMNTNKLLLVFALIYVVYSMYIYYVWSDERSQSFYNPNYSQFDLDKTKRFLFDVELEESNVNFQGKMTNLDNRGIFIKLIEDKNVKENSYLGLRLRKKTKITLMVDHYVFQFYCLPKTYYDLGYGMEFLPPKNDSEKELVESFCQVISSRLWI